jgi:predicted nucleotide-binding protein
MSNPKAHPLSDPDVTQAVKRVNDCFLRLGKGIPTHEIKAKLGPKRSVLDELVKDRILQVITESYFPTLLSIQIEDQATQERCHECTEMVLSALNRLYGEFGARPFDKVKILEGAKTVLPLGDEEMTRVGLLFATDFSKYRGGWGTGEDSGVAWLQVQEGIIDFQDFQSSWVEELARRDSDAVQMGFIPQSHHEPPSSQPKGSQQMTGEAVKDLTRRKVFVIHGRNLAIRDSMFDLLRALDLNPMEWTQLISETKKASPYVGEVLEKGFSVATAVVAVLTPDDLARLHPDFVSEDDDEYETDLTGQARPNVLFETGMALASHPDRTILVQIGKLRPFSDMAGRHSLKFDGSAPARHDLAERLRTAGCHVNTGGRDWLTAGKFEIALSKLAPTLKNSRQERSGGWLD